jgi:hypothetical protein
MSIYWRVLNKIHPKHAQYVGKYSVHGALRGILSPYWAMLNRYIQKPCTVVDKAVYYWLMFHELDQKSIGSKDWIPRFGIAHELQPKFRVMESSIRAVSIFWKLSSGLENDIYIIHSSKNDDMFLLYTKTWKTVIHSSKSDDLELYTKYWPWPTCDGSLDDYVVLPIHMGLQ